MIKGDSAPEQVRGDKEAGMTFLLITYFQNLVRDFSAGGLHFDGVAGFLALQCFADGGLHADAALERVDFLVAYDAVNFLAFGLLINHLYCCAKADRTILRCCVFDNLSPVQNAVELAQAAVNFTHAHAPIRVGGVLAAVSFCGCGLDLIDHCRSFNVFELFPFCLEFFKAFFRNQVFHGLQFKNLVAMCLVTS